MANNERFTQNRLKKSKKKKKEKKKKSGKKKRSLKCVWVKSSFFHVNFSKIIFEQFQY